MNRMFIIVRAGLRMLEMEITPERVPEHLKYSLIE